MFGCASGRRRSVRMAMKMVPHAHVRSAAFSQPKALGSSRWTPDRYEFDRSALVLDWRSRANDSSPAFDLDRSARLCRVHHDIGDTERHRDVTSNGFVSKAVLGEGCHGHGTEFVDERQGGSKLLHDVDALRDVLGIRGVGQQSRPRCPKPARRQWPRVENRRSQLTCAWSRSFEVTVSHGVERSWCPMACTSNTPATQTDPDTDMCQGPARLRSGSTERVE